MSQEKEKAPAYQWYPKDYDTDEAVKLMTYEEEGIYRRLLDHQALEGSIPSDPSQIARLVPKVNIQRFLRLWPAIAQKFPETGGRRVNGRLARQQQDTTAFLSGKSAGGKASAEARRAKNGTAQPAKTPRTEHRTEPEQEHRTVFRTTLEPASASASASAKEQERARESSPAERVVEAFRSGWKGLYGYECSLIVKSLEFMQLEQQLTANTEANVLGAMKAYFATADDFIRRAKHPLPLFLRDPMKYLASAPRLVARPVGCKHDPACADAAVHTRRQTADTRAAMA